MEKNREFQFKTIGEIAKMTGKRVIDAFLDLVVEENLDTRFLQAENNIDDEAMTKILTYPNAIVGLGEAARTCSSMAGMATPHGCWANGCANATC